MSREEVVPTAEPAATGGRGTARWRVLLGQTELHQLLVVVFVIAFSFAFFGKHSASTVFLTIFGAWITAIVGMFAIARFGVEPIDDAAPRGVDSAENSQESPFV